MSLSSIVSLFLLEYSSPFLFGGGGGWGSFSISMTVLQFFLPTCMIVPCPSKLKDKYRWDYYRQYHTVTFYHVVPHITHLRYRHVGDTTVHSADITWQKASRRPCKGPVTTMYCHVQAVFASHATYHPKCLKWLYVAHTRRLYAKVWPQHYTALVLPTFNLQCTQEVGKKLMLTCYCTYPPLSGKLSENTLRTC